MIGFSPDVIEMLALVFGFVALVLGFDFLRGRFSKPPAHTAAE